MCGYWKGLEGSFKYCQKKNLMLTSKSPLTKWLVDGTRILARFPASIFLFILYYGDELLECQSPYLFVFLSVNVTRLTILFRVCVPPPFRWHTLTPTLFSEGSFTTETTEFPVLQSVHLFHHTPSLFSLLLHNKDPSRLSNTSLLSNPYINV